MVVTVRIGRPDSLDEWKGHARAFLSRDISPRHLLWRQGEATDLFSSGDTGMQEAPPPGAAAALTVPRAFLDLAHMVIMHRDARRFAMLYTLLYRLKREPGLIRDAADPLVRDLRLMSGAVSRDMHKMRAFLRFRERDGRYIAWFEPDHHIVRANAGFFQRRFASMRWSILTPDISLHWDGITLSEGPGGGQDQAPPEDPAEEVWRSYYAATFNPARLKVKAMLKEMPRRYWNNMPETMLIPGLIATAGNRETRMIESARNLTDISGDEESDAMKPNR